MRFGGIEMAATIQQLLCDQAFNIFQGRLPLARFNACVMHVHFTIMSAQINCKGLSSRNIISCTLHLICMNAENLHGHDTLTWTHEITQTALDPKASRQAFRRMPMLSLHASKSELAK